MPGRNGAVAARGLGWALCALWASVLGASGCALDPWTSPRQRDAAAVSDRDGLIDVGTAGDGVAADVPIDVPSDRGVDVGADTGMDVGIDASIDIGMDVGIDTSIVVGADVGVDASIDVDPAGDTGVRTDVQVDAGPSEAAVCAGGQTACVDGCTNLNSDPAHCGRCTTACPSTAGGRAICFGGVCGVVCESGFRVSAAGGCETSPVRLIAPLSGARVSGMPTLRWTGAGTTYMRICADRACATVQASATVSLDGGTTFTHRPVGLARGWHFWQIGTSATSLSPIVWQFYVSSAAGSGAVAGYQPDFNGDGFGDLVVTSSVLGSNANADLLLYLGSAGGLPGTPSQSVPLSMIGCGGARIERLAGDLDGDGFVDMVTRCGSVWVWYGSPGGFLAPRWMPRFGNAIGAAGDVDQDGYADLAAYADSANKVFYGGPLRGPAAEGPSSLLMVPTAALVTEARGGLDINGDGGADIALGAPNDPAASGLACGRVYLFTGRPGRPATIEPAVVLAPGPAGDAGGPCTSFGSAIDLTDADGTGPADIVVGEAFFATSAVGRVHVYAGVVAGTPTERILPGRGTNTGANLRAPGDVDGDGTDDLLVSHESPDELYVYLNGDLDTGFPSQILLAPTGTQNLRLPTVGDVQGDGRVDIAVLFFPSNTTVGTPFPGALRVYRVDAADAGSAVSVTTRQDLAPPAGHYFSDAMQ
jgi:hypothetical protein